MAYHTGVYHRKEEWEMGFETVWQSNDFEVCYNSGRLYLYKYGFRIATLISGMPGLKKYYGGDYTKWVQAINEKDIKKIAEIRKKMIQLEKDINLIESIWQHQ
jgi:hypothetical protein